MVPGLSDRLLSSNDDDEKNVMHIAELVNFSYSHGYSQLG
jgi:hypothetical protein